MTEIQFRSDMDVELIDTMGDDARIIQAARVSTKGADTADDLDGAKGLIRYLAENRHGSPFEHVVFTWRVRAPIFVWREFMRHRIASYNEESGRYKQLEPEFYVPGDDRLLRQIGKAGHYEFVEGDAPKEDAAVVRQAFRIVVRKAYDAYEFMLEEGIAREVARMVLPVNIYSSAVVTMNLRALTNFLSLRTKSVVAALPSYPQREIEMVAELMEESFAETAPITYAAWHQAGRQPL